MVCGGDAGIGGFAAQDASAVFIRDSQRSAAEANLLAARLGSDGGEHDARGAYCQEQEDHDHQECVHLACLFSRCFYMRNTRRMIAARASGYAPLEEGATAKVAGF